MNRAPDFLDDATRGAAIFLATHNDDLANIEFLVGMGNGIPGAMSFSVKRAATTWQSFEAWRQYREEYRATLDQPAT